MVGIYKITNNITKKFYIGASKNIERRFMEHNTPKNNKYPIDKDIKKFGRENFTYEILQECSVSELVALERQYILNLKPKYNTIVKGCKRNQDFCEKVSIGTKKWFESLTAEQKQKIYSQNLKGQPKGHKVSESTKEKIRNNPNCRHYQKVMIVETKEVFNSIGELENYLKTYSGAVANYLKGKTKTVKGYHIEKV